MKRFSIGYRTLKTAIGAALAIALASYFSLDYYVSAGILTILCVQQTRKKSLHAVYTRFVASIVGMLFGYMFFEGIAYHPIVLAIMLLVFIPTLVSLRVSAGFVSSAVIILHLFDAKNFTFALLQNELALMAIGFGTGLAVNMYMGDITKELERYRLRIEALYATIFKEIAKYLRDGDSLWDGKELLEAEKMLAQAKALAYKDVENHLTRRENDYYKYFDMREKQLEIIERVLPKITTLPVIVQEAQLVANFLDELSQNVHSGNTASLYRSQLDAVRRDFAKLPLPKNHNQFLAQAALYQFIEEMDVYLAIKMGFKGLKIKK